jgi:Predicted RNA-binding protein
MADKQVDNEPDEGELAADYLEELLDIADLDGDIEIEVKNGRTYLSVASEDTDDLRPLSKPEVVQSLQELTRLAVQQKTGEFSRLILDVAAHVTGGRKSSKHR